MNIDEYIEFYECCHRALKKLRADTQITKIDCENISKKYANNIFQEMIDTGAGELAIPADKIAKINLAVVF